LKLKVKSLKFKVNNDKKSENLIYIDIELTLNIKFQIRIPKFQNERIPNLVFHPQINIAFID